MSVRLMRFLRTSSEVNGYPPEVVALKRVSRGVVECEIELG